MKIEYNQRWVCWDWNCFTVNAGRVWVFCWSFDDPMSSSQRNLSQEFSPTPVVSLNGAEVKFIDQVEYLGASLHASLKDDNDAQKQVKHFTVQETSSEAPLLSALLQLEKPCFVIVACQCMPAYSGADAHNLAENAFVLPTILSVVFLITQVTHVFAHIKLHISTGHMMPWLEASCMLLFNDVHLHPNFLYVHFNCLMLFTNLCFALIIWRF